jgi:hypothetical protein
MTGVTTAGKKNGELTDRYCTDLLSQGWGNTQAGSIPALSAADKLSLLVEDSDESGRGAIREKFIPVGKWSGLLSSDMRLKCALRYLRVNC